jgi:carboxyl-terminal processing protease
MLRPAPVVVLPMLGCLALLGAPGCAAGTPRTTAPPPAGDAGTGTPPPSDAGASVADVGPPPVATEPFTGCAGSGEAYATFDAFWSAFDRDYALFDLRLAGSTWDDVGREGCARMSESITDDALFDVLLSMAQRLDDGHVNLTADDIGRDEDAWVSEYPYITEMEEIESTVEEEYLDDDLSWAADDWFAWGTIDGDVGYLSITSMDELSPSGDDEDADVAAAAMAMQQVMNDLRGTRAMIVDVRGNGGGWDTVALEVAAWFAGDRGVAWTEQRRAGPGRFDYTAMEATYVDAMRGGGYDGEVVLLTSGATFSAAETFGLAMRVRQNVIVLGEASSGHFSDMMDHELPNGWELTLSGERYYAADGMIYETRGVPVDVAVSFDPAALSGGTDNVLEAALDRLGASY